MTAKFQMLLDEVQELPPSEQLELIQIVSFHLFKEHKIIKKHLPEKINFWKTQTLDEIIEEQQEVSTIYDTKPTFDLWPEDESIDDFLEFTYGQRQNDREALYEDPFA